MIVSMRKGSSLLLVGSLVLSQTVFAGTAHERLMDESDVWEGVIQDELMQEEQQRADMLFQMNPELFPDLSQEDLTQSVLDSKRQERTGNYLTISVGGQQVTLADVPRNEWFAPYVRDIAEKGLVSGYRDEAGNPIGRFGPGDNVTIEQMAKVIVSGVGISTSDCATPTLNATASGSWSSPYFSCAEERHWSLYQDGSVDARRNATRAEVVGTILQAYKVLPSAYTGAVFTDMGPAMQYGTLVTRAKEDGIISGYADAAGEPTGMFGPHDPVTRAEFAKIVTLGMEVYGTKQ